jgi:hypothetical protein
MLSLPTSFLFSLVFVLLAVGKGQGTPMASSIPVLFMHICAWAY